MTTVAALVAEIHESAAFLKSRNNLTDTSEKATKLRDNLTQTITMGIKRLPSISTKEANLLTDALADEPFGDILTTIILHVIDAKLSDKGDNAAEPKSRSAGADTCNQHVWPHHYLTDEEWGILRNPTVSPHAKLLCLVHRLSLLGISNPHEQTFRYWLALLEKCSYQHLPHPDDIHRDLVDMKRTITSKKMRVPFTPPLRFPEHARDLPESVRKYAYPDGLPIEVSVPDLAAIAMNKVALRGNSKLLSPAYKLQLQRGSIVKREPLESSPAHGAQLVDWTPVKEPAQPSPVKTEAATVKAERPATDSPVVHSSSSTQVDRPSPSEHSHRATPWMSSKAVQLGDGVVLTPCKDELCQDDAIATVGEPAEPLIDGLSIGKPKPLEPPPPQLASLSDYAQAAIASLKARNVRRAEETAANRRIRGKSSASASAVASPAVAAVSMKRPAAEVNAELESALKKEKVACKKDGVGVKVEKEKVKTERVSLEDRAAAVKEEAAAKEATPAAYPVAPKAMPKVHEKGDGPTHDFRNGRIYWKTNAFAFRVIRKRGLYKTEKKITWANKKTPTQGDWDAAKLAIVEYEG